MDINLAVLIDFENIAAGTDKEGLGRFDITAIMGRLVDKGRVLIARSYADWGRFSRFKQALLTANVTMYELTSHGMQDKNRADIAMVVDALELAFTKDYIDTFVIVSGDSDFTPLVLKMRELNKRVIGIGTRSSTSRLLVQACDEFIFYDSIVKSKRKSRAGGRRSSGKGGSRQAAYDLLSDAVAGLQRENPQAPLASVVKSAMRRKSPDFSESELGFTSFARFLEAARDSGYVKIERDSKAGGYRVDSVDGDDDEDHDEGDNNSNSKGSWEDPYLTDAMSVWLDALKEQKIDLLSHPVRMQVLQLIEQVATERKKKRRKVNAQYVREDVRKRLRKTFPDLPMRSIRSMFSGLMDTGQLIHKDGTAIRSASAPFHLEKDAEGLNKALVSHYLAHLEEADADLHNVDLLAELFLGDKKRKREIEEALAWLAQSQMGAGDEAALNDIDLDDLLVTDDKDKDGKKADAKSKSTSKSTSKDSDDNDDSDDKDDAPKTKKSTRSSRSRKSSTTKKTTSKTTKKSSSKASDSGDDGDDGDDDSGDSDESSDDAKAEAKPKTKRKRTRKKSTKTTKKSDDDSSDSDESSDDTKAEDSDDAPKKKTTRRRTRRKTLPDTPEEGKNDGDDLDLDSLLES